MTKYIKLNTSSLKEKPNLYKNPEKMSCPFCDFHTLESEGRIIKKHPTEPILWTSNKYPGMIDTLQTLIIESNACGVDLSTYEIPYIQSIIDFAIQGREELLNTGQFKDVILLKNHGSLSGGTVPHEHMQIIGLKVHEATQELHHYQGITIYSEGDSLLTLSDQPVTERFEFNISWKGASMTKESALYLQKVIQFASALRNGKYKDYNLVYFKDEDTHYIKVVYRGVASILEMAYGLIQIEDDLEEIVEEFRLFSLK